MRCLKQQVCLFAKTFFNSIAPLTLFRSKGVFFRRDTEQYGENYSARLTPSLIRTKKGVFYGHFIKTINMFYVLHKNYSFTLCNSTVFTACNYP